MILLKKNLLEEFLNGNLHVRFLVVTSINEQNQGKDSESLRNQLIQSQKECEQLKTELATISGLFNSEMLDLYRDIADKNAQLELEISTAQKNLQDRTQKLSQINNEFKKKGDEANTKQKELVELTKHMHSLQNELQEKSNQITSLQQTLNNKNTTIDSLRSSLVEKDHSITELEEKLKVSEKVSSKFKSSLEETRTKLYSQELTLSQNSQESIDKQIENRVKEVENDYKQELKQHKSVIYAKEQQIAILQGQIDKYKEQLNIVELKAEEAYEKQHRATVSATSITEELQHLRKEIVDKDLTIKSLTDDKKDLLRELELAETKTQSAELDKEKKLHSDDVKKLQTQIDTQSRLFSDELEKLKQKLNSTLIELADSNAENERLNKFINEKLSENETLKSQLTTTIEQKNKLDDRIVSMTSEILNLEENSKVQSQSLQEADERAKAKADIDVTKATISMISATTDLTKEKRKVFELETKIDELEAKNSALRTENASLSQSLSETRERHQRELATLSSSVKSADLDLTRELNEQIIKLSNSLDQAKALLRAEAQEHSETRDKLRDSLNDLSKKEKEIRDLQSMQTSLSCINKILNVSNSADAIVAISILKKAEQENSNLKQKMTVLNDEKEESQMHPRRLESRISQQDAIIKMLEKERNFLRTQLAATSGNADSTLVHNVVSFLNSLCQSKKLSEHLREESESISKDIVSGDYKGLLRLSTIIDSESASMNESEFEERANKFNEMFSVKMSEIEQRMNEMTAQIENISVNLRPKPKQNPGKKKILPPQNIHSSTPNRQRTGNPLLVTLDTNRFARTPKMANVDRPNPRDYN